MAHGAEVMVLDDGFQHLGLGRDLDLVLIDAGDPWAGGHLPPRGRLREPLSALARATAVLVTRVPEGAGTVPAAIGARLAELAPGTPALAARMTPRRLRTPAGARDWQALVGQRVLLFAGLGRPENLIAMVSGAGAEIVGSRLFADHHRYRPDELAALLAEAKSLDAVALTTAKDAVKLPADAPVWVVEASMEPVDGSWDSLWSLAPEVLGDGG
jgi:tetraacyldisaccharide 4'-kinase